MPTEQRVIIFDTTMRDGGQWPGASMNLEEKLRIAEVLDGMGIDIIEAGFAVASEGDFEAICEISKLVKNATVCSLARASRGDIDRAAAALRPAARALWQWHLHLAEPVVDRHQRGDLDAFFGEESARAEAGQTLRVLPQPVAEAAYEACRAHNLPRALLADQVKASAGFLTAMRFETYAALQAFIQPWAGSQGRLLARLAGHKGSWQLPLIDELTRAFFLTGRLAHLPEDLARDVILHLIEHYGGEIEQRDIFHESIEFGLPVTLKRFMRTRGVNPDGRRIVRDDAVELDRWLGERGIPHRTVEMTVGKSG